MNIQEKKIENIILYFANQSDQKTVDRLKLMKLIWLSDRLHLNKYGRLILKDRYKALPNGPIASKTMEMSKYSLPDVYEVDGYKIKSLKEFDSDFFSKSDLKIMNYVWEKFGQLDTFQLRDYSHLFPEWLRFEEELETDYTPNCYDIVIQDFFKSHDEEKFSDLINPEDSELSEIDFNIHNSIQSILRA